jgi:hypothetical protein
LILETSLHSYCTSSSYLCTVLKYNKTMNPSQQHSKRYRIVRGILLVCAVSHCVYESYRMYDGHGMTSNRASNTHTRRLSPEPPPAKSPPATTTHKPRVLYIVTSLVEFDTGGRATTLGHDRFNNTLIPVVRESTTSMVQAGYHVDVYLIAHYNPSPQHWHDLQAALSPGTSLELWSEASPYYYKNVNDRDPNKRGTLVEHTMALSRQHRFVIKDRLLDYDMFVSFEDDMLIKGAHVQQYESLTRHLYRLRQSAPETLSAKPSREEALHSFYGPMTQAQYARMIPGLFRVEVALPGWHPHDKNLYKKIPLDYHWNDTIPQGTLDPLCCVVNNETVNDHIPANVSIHDIYFWETSIDVLGVRRMPEDSGLGWVLMQAGNDDTLLKDAHQILGEYWSGTDHDYYHQPRQPRSKNRYVNNQGGWMATQRQVYEWHTQQCGTKHFLPPYNPRAWESDGLSKPVEFWSGGMHIFGAHACNLQRIMPLAPEMFSRHLLYHTSNNKQRSDNVLHRYSSRTINEFWAQLNTVRKNAERKIIQQQQQQSTNYRPPQKIVQ